MSTPFGDELGIGGLDSTMRGWSDRLLRARWRVAEAASKGGLDDLMQAVVEEAKQLTGSQAGFYYFVEPDQERLRLQEWSRQDAGQAGVVRVRGTMFSVKGVKEWSDCLRMRSPVVQNDSRELRYRQGLSEGPAKVERELVVSMGRGSLVMGLLGVGDKPTDYSEEDVSVLEGFAGMASDLVVGKQAEVALRVSEERYRSLVMASPDGITVLGLDGRVEYSSPRALEMFGGGDLQSVMGQHALEWVVPEERERAAFLLQELMEGRTTGEGEFWLLGPHGVRFRGEILATVLRGGQGQPTGVLLVTRDITERVQMAEQVRETQKLEAIGQLAGGVAHDFNNILAAMMMNLGMLLEDRQLGAGTREGLQDVLKLADRAAGLTRQLLMFGRRSVLEVRRVDLNEVIVNLLRMLRRVIGEHIDLRFEGGGAEAGVEVDVGMLETVIMNLAVNARDAMPRGGRLTLVTEVVVVTEEMVRDQPSRRVGRQVCLRVMDTGEGMDAATLGRAFEPFFTTKPPGQGTGLGLATVHGIVSQHRGWVEVESAVGRGTEFRVWLPAVGLEVKGGDDVVVAGAPSPGCGETILLVEDEMAVRRAVARMLERLGYRVIEATQGVDAWRCFEALGSPLDLLLTDVVMPGGISGLDLAERMREKQADLEVVITSGYSEDVVSSGRVRAAGFTYLPKPFETSGLAAVVRHCLDHRKTRRAGNRGGDEGIRPLP